MALEAYLKEIAAPLARGFPLLNVNKAVINAKFPEYHRVNQ